MTGEAPYNPLDKLHLAESIARALLQGAVHSLPPESRFDGAGIYAIYYTGPFPAYQRVAAANADGQYGWPIYVGKAIPEGGRTARPEAASTRRLYGRLRHHRASIQAVANLDVGDFACRYLVVDPLWIPLGEGLLVSHYRPLWNVRVEGFGINAPGAGRGGQRRSCWDTIHPGRKYAAKRPPNAHGQEELLQDVQNYLESQEAPQALVDASRDDPRELGDALIDAIADSSDSQDDSDEDA